MKADYQGSNNKVQNGKLCALKECSQSSPENLKPQKAAQWVNEIRFVQYLDLLVMQAREAGLFAE